jgi:hypothetical protein
MGGVEPEVSVEEVGRCRSVNAPYLEETDAYLEAALKEHEEFVKEDMHGQSMVSQVKCRVLGIYVKVNNPVALNRGLNAAVELAIKLSRGEREGIDEYLRIMKRTMPKENYDSIMDFLKNFL